MKGLRLYKIEKLCSETAIGTLFSRSGADVHTSLAYPLRVAWRLDTRREVRTPRFLISVPKKRLRHAVDRVTMRRRIREVYRLNRHKYLSPDLPLDIAIIYVADTLLPSSRIAPSLLRLLSRISAEASGGND